MRKFILLATAISIIAGCSKNQLEPAASINDPEISETVIENAKKDFSVILSRAVSSDENLRVFIKENALKQFDMDYDVFYPYVRIRLFLERTKHLGMSCSSIQRILPVSKK